MRRPPHRSLALAAVLALVAGCSGGDDDPAADPQPTSTTTATPTFEPAPAFIPIAGGTDDDGEPLPPPIHATFSVVVRGDTSWFPYAGRELQGLDVAATEAIAGGLRQIDVLLDGADIAASIELAYGPAAAICAEHPDLLDTLTDAGHVIGVNVITNGESFRAVSALEPCGIVPRTISGLAAMADPVGPAGPTVESFIDAMAIISIQDFAHVVGPVSWRCRELGLSEPSNEYGTGAETAPWRSAWTDGNPCADSPRGQIVMIDQTPLPPGEEVAGVDLDAIDAIRTRMTQTLGWAADMRFRDPAELPAPGFLTWGVTVRLDDLIAPTDTGEDEDGAGTTTTALDETGIEVDDEDAADAPALDLRTAPLDVDTLAALGELLAEWAEPVADGRVVWVTPEAVAEILRPG
ncbi:MAG: hypothetical protein JJE52_07430 [Acidimicrobiia bacterium]|nr:hypothetical protein [Acidimicrobiia bacterium]